MYIQRDTEYDYTIPRHEADCADCGRSLRVTAEHLYLAADWPMAMSLHAYIHVYHVTASATILVLMSFNGTASGNLVHISMVVSMYLCPSEGGLTGPVISIHITEKGVQINGNFPIGALATVHFETFLWPELEKIVI